MSDAKRSLAAAMPSPMAVPPKHPVSTHSSAARQAYSRKLLQDRARKSYPRTHIEKGFYLKQKNDQNGALLEFLKATQENPHLVRGFYEQALIFRSRGYRKLAASSLEQALAIQPNYNEARVLLATVRLEQGNFGSAVQELSRSLGLDSTIAQEGSPDAKSSSTQPTSGLLSIDIPAILQSIHGVIKPPTSNDSADAKLAEKSKSVATGDDKRPEISTNSQPGNDSPPVSEPESDRARKKRAKKEKHKKSLLNHLRGADETIKSASESSKLQPSTKEVRSGIENSGAGQETVATTTSGEISLKSLLNGEKAPTLSKYSEVPSYSSNHADTSHNKGGTDGSDGHDNINSGPDLNTSGVDADSSTSNADVSSNNKAPAMFGNNDTFIAPQHGIPVSGLLSSILSAPFKSGTTGSATRSPQLPAVKLDDDEWAKKLKNYAEHGANSLKAGEAFMFAEDSGEASLFLADGTTIRRIVAQPKDSNEVMRERRPDITSAEDMLYGLSLLGKLIPKMDNQQSTGTAPAVEQPIGSFRGDNLMSGSQSFWGWLKTVLKFN